MIQLRFSIESKLLTFLLSKINNVLIKKKEEETLYKKNHIQKRIKGKCVWFM